MISPLQKLQSDLVIAEEMVDRLAAYLRADNLFGKMPVTMPALTLGGYLLRQHRLTALRPALPPGDQERLGQVVQRFFDTIQERVVRSEERAHQEFGARLRQWEETIRDLRRDLRGNAAYYATAVEPRAMISALQEMLTMPPYQFDETLLERLELIDNGLRVLFAPGDFVWFEEWEPAYPRDEYWYLYGGPRLVSRA